MQVVRDEARLGSRPNSWRRGATSTCWTGDADTASAGARSIVVTAAGLSWLTQTVA
jgi:hypothetical protein